MMHPKRGGNMLSLMGKPLCVVLLLTGLFGLIWLRSSIIAAAYDLRTLEEKRMDALKETKLLLAERAKLTSIEKINASFRGPGQGEGRTVAGENIFSNRVRLIHVRRNKGQEPYKASFTGAATSGP